MDNSAYISYLNTLHNYNAQNESLYSEKNINSKFYNETIVEIDLFKEIVEKLKNEKPHLIILTGHAGDGKTNILYQVLNKFNVDKSKFNDKKIEINLYSNTKCIFIKDFSEFDDNEKVIVLRYIIEFSKNNFAFIVANTGPLINTFGELFEKNIKEKAKIKLIEAMDNGINNIQNIMGYNISVINVAKRDNTNFSIEFLKNIIKPSLWEKCNNCIKKSFCHILKNVNLIRDNKEKVDDFISKHYFWLSEHNKRLTIRSITEQLTYMIIGGINCNEVKNSEKFNYLFTNLFFGYVGLEKNANANSILAIKEIQNIDYSNKRLRTDKNLLITENFNNLFKSNVVDIILNEKKESYYKIGWAQYLKRIYIFLNNVTDEKILEKDCEDIFSRQFNKYMKIVKYNENDKKLYRSIEDLIFDALLMLYIGEINDKGVLPITLSKKYGITQNVQLVIGELYKRDFKLSVTNNNKNIIKLKVLNNTLETQITLPLLNYFEELKNGIISTNIDPVLSYGIESLKEEISRQALNLDEEDLFKIISDDIIDFEIINNLKLLVYKR